MRNITILKITLKGHDSCEAARPYLRMIMPMKFYKDAYGVFPLQLIFLNFPLNPFRTSPICCKGKTKVSCIYILSFLL